MEWHSFSSETHGIRELDEIVSDMLTEPVSRQLPASWQGDYSIERARTWIKERDEEGTTLLVLDRHAKREIGLIILFEEEPTTAESGIEVRIGFLLSESAWGKGFASEMINKLVNWCRARPAISSLAGGVVRDNVASRRVLEKCGFSLVKKTAEDDLFRLTFQR